MRLRDKVADLRTMRALFPAAEAEAGRDGRELPGPEDLVLAATTLEEGSARRALASVGITPEDLRRGLAEQHAEALASGGVRAGSGVVDESLPAPAEPRGPVRTTGAAQDLFREVVDRVRAERSRLHGAWIVLVAAEADRGPLARALRHLDVDPAALRAAAREQIDRLDGSATR